MHAIVQPSPGKGGAAGAGDGGPLLKAALIDSRPLLAAALFVEFDADGSGEVSRDEFVAHVWMLLRASEEQRQRFTFAKLDVNRSGALERSDLVASMRRQLSIARTLSPLLVQLQLRRHALTETSPRPLRDLSETSRPFLQAHPHRDRAEAARRDRRRGRARDNRRDAHAGRADSRRPRVFLVDS